MCIQRVRIFTKPSFQFFHIAPFGAHIPSSLWIFAVVLQSTTSAACRLFSIAAKLPATARHTGDTLLCRSSCSSCGRRLATGGRDRLRYSIVDATGWGRSVRMDWWGLRPRVAGRVGGRHGCCHRILTLRVLIEQNRGWSGDGLKPKGLWRTESGDMGYFRSAQRKLSSDFWPTGREGEYAF